MDLIQRVERLRADKKYYRIRTDYGENFNSFYENNFVAIGYNYIGRNRLLHADQTITKQLIATNENLSSEFTTEKKKISRIFNMLHEFKDLSRGDVVIIPSQDSNRIAFGEISDNEIYQEVEGTHNCDYIKRRHVNWFKIINFEELDPILNSLKARGDVINDFSYLAQDIDKVMRFLFIKNNLSHFVIDIAQTEPIRLVNLIELLESIKVLSQLIIDKYNLEENVDDITIKLNLQSPGITELIKRGTSLLVIAAMISVSSCNRGESGIGNDNEQQILDLNNEFQNQIDNLNNSLDTLNVPRASRQFYRQ